MPFRHLFPRFFPVFFAFLAICWTTAAAAPVPMVPKWKYVVANNVDYRSFDNGAMTINVTRSETPFTTYPHGRYPAGQDFVVSVDFADYTTGTITGPSTFLHSDTQLAIQWDADPINGVPVYSEIDIRRTTFNDGQENYSAIYSTQSSSGSVNILHQVDNVPGTANNGTFTIEKAGNNVTVSLKSTTGETLYSRTFSSIPFTDSEITVNLRTINGPRTGTSVRYANLQMDPVPYRIEDSFLAHQINEQGGNRNLLAFNVRDTSGDYVTGNMLTVNQLLAPSGSPVPIEPVQFSGAYQELEGEYDAEDGQWHYESAFSPNSMFTTTFDGALAVGTYRLLVTTDNGLLYSVPFQATPQVELPVLSSTTFSSYKDSGGNLFINYQPPYDEAFLAAGLNTQVVAFVDVYNGAALRARMPIALPTHLGHIAIPAQVVQQYEAQGTDRRVTLILRQQEGSTASFSTAAPLIPADGPPVAGDVNGDGKIGLDEAIHALQVSAGGDQ